MNLESLSRNERIDYIIRNKTDLINIKKAAVKYADSPSLANKILSEGREINDPIVKALTTSTDKDTDEAIFRTVIGNTYYWMDSHDDVHLDSTFTKSIKERSDSIFHLHDHIYQITAKVGQPQKIYESSVLWSDLGVNKSGYTTGLFLDSKILKSYNELIFDQYRTKQIDQHSVGMYYVKFDLAVDDKDFEEGYKIYSSNIDKIGNREKAEEKGYFWAVAEAKLIEISAVLQGSNELTPTIDAKTNEEIEEAIIKSNIEAKENDRRQIILRQLGY